MSKSVRERLEDELKKDSADFTIVFKEQPKILDCEKVFRQYEKTFKECDYLFERHNVKYCITLFKLNDSLLSISSDEFKSILRLSDKYIRIDNRYHIVFFTFADIKNALKAIARVERVLMSRYKIYDKNIFVCTIANKEKGSDIFKLLKKLALSIEESNDTTVIDCF